MVLDLAIRLGLSCEGSLQRKKRLAQGFELRKKTTERTSWKELPDRELQVLVADVVTATPATRG